MDGAAAVAARSRVGRHEREPTYRARSTAGLTFRPLDDTVRGTLEHAETTDDAGLKPERERELLEAWQR